MIGLAILLLTGLGILWIAGIGASVWMLTHPVRRTYAAAVARGRAGDPSEASPSRRYESWEFDSRGLKLKVWDIEGGSPSGPVVVVTHGWGDSKMGVLARIGALSPVASRVVAWDLAGHGESEGVCRLGTAEVEDLARLLDRLGEPVVLLGWSLGAGVSLGAARARERMVRGVVAEAPYRVATTPARNVLRARGLPAWMIVGPAFGVLRCVWRGLGNGDFDRAGIAGDVKCPVLVVHGAADVVSPVEDGREIAAACGGKMVEIERGGHNDLWSDPEWIDGVAREVMEFVGRVGGSAGGKK